jgi:uncharacterized OB-fold protein
MSKESLAPKGSEAQFNAYLAAGKFMIQRSRSSGRHVFYPRVVEPASGADDLEWVEAAGHGTVYATTCMRRPADKGGDYNVALIDLAEGPRMMATVENCAPDEVRIGQKVKARIATIDHKPAIVFYPVEG